MMQWTDLKGNPVAKTPVGLRGSPKTKAKVEQVAEAVKAVTPKPMTPKPKGGRPVKLSPVERAEKRREIHRKGEQRRRAMRAKDSSTGGKRSG